MDLAIKNPPSFFPFLFNRYYRKQSIMMFGDVKFGFGFKSVELVLGVQVNQTQSPTQFTA